MKMMMELDNLSLEEWNKDVNEETLSKNDPASAAADALAKIGYELGVKFLLPIFIPMIQQALSSQDWKAQHAGLMGIAQLSEGCAEKYKNEMDNIVK